MATKKKTTKKTKTKTTKRAAAKTTKPIGEVLPRDGAGLTKPLLVRFTPAEYATIRKASFEKTRSCAGFIRAAVLDQVNALLLAMKPKDREAWFADAQRVAATGEP